MLALPHESIGKTHLSPMASCISFAATVLSTPPLTAPITRPVSPQISRIRAISFPTNSSYKNDDGASLCELTYPRNTGPAYKNIGIDDVRTIVQSSLQPQILCTNRPMTSFPRGV